MDSLVLETVIGLVFVFAVFSALVTVLTEAISRFLGLRGEYLLRGLRTLVDGESHFDMSWKDMVRKDPKSPDPEEGEPADPVVTRLLHHPIIASSAPGASVPADAGNAKLSRKQRVGLPSYISSRSFAAATVSLLVPNTAGETSFDQLRTKVNGLDSLTLKERLVPLVNQAEEDVEQFRTLLEGWYDDHMARVSGWYKRKVKWISLGLAAVLVVLFNLNTISITRSLYADEAVRTAIVNQAARGADCRKTTGEECFAQIREQVDSATGSVLPLGYGVVDDCIGQECSVLQKFGFTSDGGFVEDAWALLLVLLGWVLMATAVLPGSRFWFDALSRLGTLRETGPKPVRSTS